MATYLNLPRAYSITVDKYGIDALRDRALPLILAIPTYRNFEVKQQYRGRPDLVANDTYGNVNLWWVPMAYNGITSFRDIVEGTSFKDTNLNVSIENIIRRGFKTVEKNRSYCDNLGVAVAQAVTHYKDQIYIDLKIEDVDLPDTPNMVSTISINESVDTITPVMQFTFYDMQSSIVRQLALSEATKLKILLGPTRESAVVRKFRKFSAHQQPSTDGPRAIVNFILDCPQYITSAKVESYEGTSSETLSQVASKCGLEADCTDTNDKMVWLNYGNSRGVFVEDVALHGYKDSKSCMLKALTSENVLRYKDVMYEINNTDPKVTFAVNTEQGVSGSKVIQVRDTREKSTSGAMNNWLNYGWKHNEHTLKGESTLHKEYDVQSNEKHLPINSDVKSDVGSAKISFQKKLDCRNTHENYIKAFYGNTRGRALFNTSLPILIEEPSNVSLLDVVYYRHLDVDKKTNANSGKYIVTGKVTYVTNGIFYTEKLILTRFGIVESGNTPLL